MFRNITIFILLLFAITTVTTAHDRIVRGKVTDEEGKGIPGATVKIEKTIIGAIANKEGEFVLKNVPDGEHKIRITAVGYSPLYYTLKLEHEDGDQYDIDLSLKQSVSRTGTVVVSATKSEKLYEDIPIKMSFIDSKVFEATESVSLRDGIRFQPGLRVEANCQNCGFSQVRLNGLDGRYTQILIDSRPIFSALNGLYGLDQIPSNMVERVEVVRGGGSALYGGNAIGGIVNIITKEPNKNQFSGKYNHSIIDKNSADKTLQLSSSIISDNYKSGIYLFGNFRERDAWDANGDGFTEASYIRENSLGLKSYYNFNAYTKLSLSLHSLSEYRRGGDNIELPPHLAMMAEDLTHQVLGGNINFSHFFNGGKDQISIFSSVNITDKDNYTGVEKDPNGYGYTDNMVAIFGTQYSHTFDDFGIGSAVFTSGLEYQYEEVENVATGYNASLNQTTRLAGLFVQNDWLITEEWSILLGLRADKHNFIDNLIFTPRITSMLKLSDKISVRGNFTSGYRAPQAYDDDLHAELRGGVRQIIKLSDDLKEERSWGYSGSIDYGDEIFNIPVSFSFEYFTTNLNDVFVNEEQGEDGSGNTIFVKKNGEGATVNGITFETQVNLSRDYQIQAAITYQQSEYDLPIQWSEGDADAGIAAKSTKNMLRTPDLYGYLTAYMTLHERLQFDVTAVYTGSMYAPHYAGAKFEGAITEDRLVETPDFIEFNTKFAYTLIEMEPEIKLTFSIYNILDSFQDDFDLGAYRDAGYIYGPVRPRTFTIGLSTAI